MPSDGRPWRVFLSHTLELREHPRERSYVAAAEAAVMRAGHAVSNMAYFAARDSEPAAYCTAEVERADVFVGIIGVRYGATVRGRPEVSYTELEFEAATAAGMPRLIFLIRPDAPDIQAVDQPTEHFAKQQTFRHRLQEAGLIVAAVNSPHVLEIGLFQALVELRAPRLSIQPADPMSSVATAQTVSAAHDDSTASGGRGKLWTFASPRADIRWWSQRIFDTAYDRIGQPSAALAESINARLGPGTVSPGMLDAFRSGESLPPLDVGLTTLIVAGADVGSLTESIGAASGLRQARDDQPSRADLGLMTSEVLPATMVELDRLPAANAEEPWDRLLKILSRPATIDEPTILDLEQQTIGLYDLETQVPARQVFQHLTHHLDILAEILGDSLAPSVRRRLIRATGETAVLGGWMAWDQANRPVANRLYKLTFAASQESAEPSIAACALAYMSYAASAQGRVEDAQRMLSEARERVDRKALPGTYAWLTAREAEELTKLDQQEALRLMDLSMTCYEQTNPAEERPWTGFLDRTRMLSFALTVSLHCGRFNEARQLADQALHGAGSVKIRVLLLLELAATQIRVGNLEEGMHLTSQALSGVMSTEMTWGMPKLKELGDLLTVRHSSNPQAKRLTHQIAVVTHRRVR